MDNWQKDLKNRFSKIKRDKNINLSNINNNINVKGGDKMISAKGALKDYDDALNDEKLSDVAKVVRILKVVIKLLLGIRTNQTGGVRKDDEKPVGDITSSGTNKTPSVT